MKYLTEAEDQHTRQQFTDLSDPRTLALALVYYTGARVSEISQLNVDDLQEDILHIKGLKGSEDRDLPLPPHVLKALQDLIVDINYRRANGIVAGIEMYPRIFSFHTRTLQRTWERLRPDGCKKSIHSLRHTCAVRVYRKTKDILLTKDYLGHKCINNTVIYAKIVNQQEEFRKLVSGE